MKTQLQQAHALPLAVPGHDLDAYIRAVNSVPVLSVDEERQLTERLYFDEDLDAAVAQVTAVAGLHVGLSVVAQQVSNAMAYVELGQRAEAQAIRRIANDESVSKLFG